MYRGKIRGVRWTLRESHLVLFELRIKKKKGESGKCPLFGYKEREGGGCINSKKKYNVDQDKGLGPHGIISGRWEREEKSQLR